VPSSPACSVHEPVPSFTCPECQEAGRRWTAAPPLTWHLSEFVDRAFAEPLSLFGRRFQAFVARHEKFFRAYARPLGFLLSLPLIGFVGLTFPIIEMIFPDSDSRFVLEVVVVVPAFLLFVRFARFLLNE
jgi:hypothetical protein